MLQLDTVPTAARNDERLLRLVKAELERLEQLKPLLRKLEAYTSGNHFGDNFEYWQGRPPKPEQAEQVKKQATSDDQIGPAIDRLVSAIVGRDPDWTLRLRHSDVTSALLEEGRDLSEDERALAQFLRSLEQAGADWHEAVGLHDKLRDLADMLFAFGRATIRLYVPDEYDGLPELRLGRDGRPLGFASLNDALEVIEVQVLSPLQAGAVRNEHGRAIAYYFLYSKELDDGFKESWLELHEPGAIRRFKLEAGELIEDEYAAEGGEPPPNPLYDPTRRRRPNFLMHEVRRRKGPLVTDELIRKQNRLNETLTYMARNVDYGGFRALVTSNAEEPMQENDAGELEPAAWTFEPNVVLRLRGIPTQYNDLNEPTAFATPTFDTIDPVDSQVFITASNHYREMILNSLDQGFTLAAFAAVSGVSKKESREAFDKRVINESGPIGMALTWVVSRALRLASVLTRNGPDLTGLSAHAKLYLDVTRGNLELFKALMDGHAKGYVSLEVLVENNPAVSDVTAELKRVENRRAEIEGEQAASRQRREELQAQLLGVGRPPAAPQEGRS